MTVLGIDATPSYLLIEKLPPPKTTALQKNASDIDKPASASNVKAGKKIFTHPEVSQSDRQSINKTLQAWINASEEYDIKRYVSFYAQTLEGYYEARNVSRRAVEVDKLRQFGQEKSPIIDIHSLSVNLNQGQRAATVRLTKRVALRNDHGESHSRDVMQELRWLKSSRGWKIVSERDLY